MDSSWRTKNVFITGANGFVGSWLAKKLIEEGASVVTVVRDLNPKGGLYLHNIDDKVIEEEGETEENLEKIENGQNNIAD